MVTTASLDTICKAMNRINKRYKNNVMFNRLDVVGKRIHFTLRVRSSKGLGARRSHSGRRLACACWHAHGHLFEAILKYDPSAKIMSQGVKTTITVLGGNWVDKNIGSMVQPIMFSQACDCNTKT
jgi:hypothetical protein